jgi:hypothetical protein
MVRMVLLLALSGLAGSCGPRSERDEAPDGTEIRGERIDAQPEADKLEMAESEAAGARAGIVNESEMELRAEREEEGPVSINFDELASFDYAVPDAPVDVETVSVEEEEKIPASIRALDGRLVRLKGFMLPTRLEAGLTTEFLLMRDQSMCCFGVVPRINEWVSVRMEGGGVRPLMDQPVTVFGTLHVGATFQNGMLLGLYQMEGEDLAGPLDL